MTDLTAKFEQAALDVKTISKKPGTDVLLKLYSLYKQGSEGDVQGKRPGMTDFKGRAKYDAWASLNGVSSDQAKAEYIALVEELM
ncbi:acyl-CoA-binding protein [Reinekea marinisedimentorum]|uniref:Acyl-CoA-binding protein n=1 Tax=Reinekea marinisedimentorum TaxID=230495 RepID=A0A4R3I4I7_9GAMM|nr:acyl-CoA-binding protein [Reinekea marinisedimentorum]TCS40687.1 acyl-CoA-binding protein [Reinekea marinisedimentorum]